MSSHSVSQISLLRLHDLWLDSLTGASSAILSSQESLLSIILAHSLPSTLIDEVSTALLINIALLHAFNGSLALASITFEKAIALSPHCAIAHFGLGLTRFLEARDVGAIKAWETCMKSFETIAPQDIQADKRTGTNDIWYHMWRPCQYGENQRGGSHQDDLSQDNSTHCRGWILAKNAVKWNIHVARQRKNIFDKNTGLQQDRNMLFVKGIPAGLLFGPPPQLRQEAYSQSNRVNEQLPKVPVEYTDIDSSRAHTDDNGLTTRSASALTVLQVASIPTEDCDSLKTYGDQPQPAASGLTLNIKNDDCGYLSIYHKRGQSSPAIVQLGSQTEDSENGDEFRVNAVAYQPAVNSTLGDSQPNMIPSSHIKRHHEGYRTLEDLATFNTLENRKPLPLIPSRQKDMSHQESRYPLALSPQKLPPPTPPPPPPTLSPSRNLSTKASSLARFFTMSKRVRRGRETHNRTGSDIDASIDTDPHAHTGIHAGEDGRSSSRLSSHSTSRGFFGSRSNTLSDDDNRDKGKPPVPKRPAPPMQGLSTQDFHEGHPRNLAFVKADTEPRYIGVGLAGKLELEKNMETRVDEEVKPPKPLFFPREEINRKPEWKSGIGLGLGKGKTMPKMSSQHRDDMRPEPLSIPHSAPLATTGFVKGSAGDNDGSIVGMIPREERRRVLIFNDQSDIGIDAAYSLARGTAKPRTRIIPPHLDQYPPGPAVSVSVPTFPQRDNSPSPVGLSSSAPPCQPPQHPPPAQQRPLQQRQQHLRRGRPLSQLSQELEWNDEKGDFIVRNDEGKGRGHVKVERDESSNSSMRTRRDRDQNSSRRQRAVNEGDAASITSTTTTSTSPREETQRRPCIKIPSYNSIDNSTNTSTINLKEQKTSQSQTYASPTLTSSPLPISPDFGAVFNLGNEEEEEEEEEDEEDEEEDEMDEPDKISQGNININDIIEDAIKDFQNYDDAGGYSSTDADGDISPIVITGTNTYTASQSQSHHQVRGYVNGGRGYNDNHNNDGYHHVPAYATMAAATAGEESPGLNNEGEEEDDEDDENEDEESVEEEKAVKEVVEPLGGLLLSSATFQGFQRGIAGQWYDGKWH